MVQGSSRKVAVRKSSARPAYKVREIMDGDGEGCMLLDHGRFLRPVGAALTCLEETMERWGA